MPVYKCPNGKFRIGTGKCMYDTRKKAEIAYAGYLAVSHIEIGIEHLRHVRNVLLRLREVEK